MLLGEILCPYSCYYEAIRLPDGRLLNETFGCDVQCDTTFSSVDRCTEVTFLTVYLSQIILSCIISDTIIAPKINL